MKNIGIICKPGRPEAREILKDLLPWLKSRGCEVFVDEQTAAVLNIGGFSREEIVSRAEVVFVLGGDGTMLSVSRLLAPRGIPIVGINLGSMGFITECSRDEVREAVQRVLAGGCVVEERLMLSAAVRREGRTISSCTVLNDVVVNKGALARIIDMETFINGTYVTTFKADGLIISTPTGSTAYSLSAGGPIIYPTLDSFVLTPICSHTLTNRPIVLHHDVRIEVVIKAPTEDVYLTMDGQEGLPLRADDVIEMNSAPYKVRLLVPADRDYFKILRTKLKWGER